MFPKTSPPLCAAIAFAADVRLVVSTIQILATGHGWERWGLVPTEVSRLVRLIGSTAAQGVVLISDGKQHTVGLDASGKILWNSGDPYPLDVSGRAAKHMLAQQLHCTAEVGEAKLRVVQFELRSQT